MRRADGIDYKGEGSYACRRMEGRKGGEEIKKEEGTRELVSCTKN